MTQQCSSKPRPPGCYATGHATGWLRRASALLVMVQLALFSFPPPGIAAPAGEVGVIRIAVLDVYGRSDKQRVTSGDALFYEEEVTTGTKSAVQIDLLDESVLSMGENSSMILDSMVYQVNRGIVEGAFTMATGVLHFKSAGVPMAFIINTPVADIGIRGTEFDIMANDTETEVAVQQGTVEVISSAGTQAVTAGQSYAVDAQGNATLGDTPSPQLASAVSKMLTTLADTDLSEPASMVASAPNDARAAVQQARADNPEISLENLLAMELEKGLVLIEMLPDIAPNHVARVTELVNSGAYVGKTFDFVSPGYAVEIGQLGMPAGGTPLSPLAAEISDTPFVRGTVGMSHLPNQPDSAVGEFFVTLDAAPSLDQAYTVWGRVVYGMHVLDALSPGRPPQNPDAITRLKPIVDMLTK